MDLPTWRGSGTTRSPPTGSRLAARSSSAAAICSWTIRALRPAPSRTPAAS